MLQAPVSDKKTKPEASRSEGERESERVMGLTGWGERSAVGVGQGQPNSVAATQQAYGNQAALRIMRGQRQRSPVANPVPGGILQRKCACGNSAGVAGTCTECQEKQAMALQRKATGSESESVGEVPPIVHEVLRSPGQSLEPETRTFMESRFGHDFRGVQIYTDARAAESAKAVNALAYTVGQKVVFGKGQYNPETDSGRQLLGHELFHTLQQQVYSDPSNRKITLGQASTIYEQQADEVASSLVQSNLNLLPNALKLPHGTTLQRQVGRMSRSSWQFEADRLTIEQLSAEIDRMRRELSIESSEQAEETLERLRVFEQTLMRQDARMLEHQRSLRRRRERMDILEIDNVFLSGFAAGSLQEIPPGEVYDFFVEDFGEHPVEFMDGCSEGVGRGFVDGATGLVEAIESISSIPELMGNLALYAIQHPAELEQIREDITNEAIYQLLDPSLVRDRSYIERRERYVRELQQITLVIQRFATQIARDPTIVIQWSGDLGLALGQSFGRTITEDFLRASPREQGVIIGRIIGQILFEVILELILAVTTVGVGTLIRAIPAAARGVRAFARVLRFVEEMAEASPLVRRLISFGEEAVDKTTDLNRTVERVREAVPASGDEIAEASSRQILDSAPDPERPVPLDPERPTIEPEASRRPTPPESESISDIEELAEPPASETATPSALPSNSISSTPPTQAADVATPPQTVSQTGAQPLTETGVSQPVTTEAVTPVITQDTSSTATPEVTASPATVANPLDPETAWNQLREELGNQPAQPTSTASAQDRIEESVGAAQAAGWIDAQGNPQGVDQAVQEHGHASFTREALGHTGQTRQSAHIGATSLLRTITGYSRRAAQTVLLDPSTHRAFDLHWMRWISNRRRAIRAFGSSDFTAPLSDVLDAQRQAIRQIPGLTDRQRSTMESLLAREFYILASELPDGLATRVPLPAVLGS